MIAISIFTGCDSDPAPVLNCVSSGPIIELISSSNVTGCKKTDGNIDVTFSGGSGAVTLSLNGIGSENGFFSNLAEGLYTIEVQDENGCTDELMITLIAENTSLTVMDVEVIPSGCGSSNGSISVNATGSGVVSYSLDNGAEQENADFNNLTAGEYVLHVTDEEGCEFNSLVKVTTGVSYVSQVQSIIITNCAISNCHNGDRSSLPDFLDASIVRDRSISIKSRTQSGNMPPRSSGLTLTNEQKDLIVCWVDDGALDN